MNKPFNMFVLTQLSDLLEGPVLTMPLYKHKPMCKSIRSEDQGYGCELYEGYSGPHRAVEIVTWRYIAIPFSIDKKDLL